MQQTVVLMEPDQSVAEPIITFLKQENYHVKHYIQLPEGGVQSIAGQLAETVLDMEQNNTQLSAQFEQIIGDLQVDTASDIANLNLMESEEKVLVAHLDKAIRSAQAVFDQAKEREASYKKIMVGLLKKLDKA